MCWWRRAWHWLTAKKCDEQTKQAIITLMSANGGIAEYNRRTDVWTFSSLTDLSGNELQVTGIDSISYYARIFEERAALWTGLVQMDGVKLWLDDVRRPPDEFDGCLHARTATEAIAYLETEKIALISLDHDLGATEAGTGYDVAKWIEQAAYHGKLAALKWFIHSANPVGFKNMEAALKNADRYWEEADLFS